MGSAGCDGFLIAPSRASASLEQPGRADLLCGKAGPGILACLSPRPASFPAWGVCARVICRDIASSMSSSSGRQPSCVLAVPSCATFWVQAQRCRHAFRMPPEKRDLQVRSLGRDVAKPQLCTFFWREGKGRGAGTGLQGLLWKAYSPHMNIVSRVPACNPDGQPGPARRVWAASVLCGPSHAHLPPGGVWEAAPFSPIYDFVFVEMKLI